MLRFEAFILAAECRSLDTALRLVACGRGAGFRESGVTGTRRFIAGLRCSLRLEVGTCLCAFSTMHTRAEQGTQLVEEWDSQHAASLFGTFHL